MINPFRRKPDPAKAHAKAVEAVQRAKARKDSRAVHHATSEAYKALHQRLRVGA